MLLVLDFKRVISKYSEVRTYGIFATGDFRVGETCEISVFKLRCDRFGRRCGRVDCGTSTRFANSRQDISLTQDLINVCDGAPCVFVMKQDEGTFWLRWKANSERREVAHPVASASTATDEASYGRDRERAHPPDEVGIFQQLSCSRFKTAAAHHEHSCEPRGLDGRVGRLSYGGGVDCLSLGNET